VLGLTAGKGLGDFKLHCFLNGKDFMEYLSEKVSPIEEIDLLLSDFDLGAEPRNGIELIEEARLAEKSVLVTANYENDFVIQNSQKTGLRLLPKSLVPYVSLKTY
jgi:hypothetical protein